MSSKVKIIQNVSHSLNREKNCKIYLLYGILYIYQYFPLYGPSDKLTEKKQLPVLKAHRY